MAIRLEEKKHLSPKGLQRTVRDYFSKVSSSKKVTSGKKSEIQLVGLYSRQGTKERILTRFFKGKSTKKIREWGRSFVEKDL